MRKGLIKRFKASQSQVKNRIELANLDIKAERTIMANDRDWAFSIAYNALLQATRALMFAKGFRPGTGEGQHKVTVQFAEITLGEKFQDEVLDELQDEGYELVTIKDERYEQN